MSILFLIIWILLWAGTTYFAAKKAMHIYDEHMKAEIYNTPYGNNCNCAFWMTTLNNIPLISVTMWKDVDTQKTYVELDAIAEIFTICNITKESLSNNSCCNNVCGKAVKANEVKPVKKSVKKKK